MRRHLWLLTSFALALGLLAGPGGVSAKVYHWTDAAGTPHYTDRVEEVPAAYRDQSGDYLEELDQSTRLNIIDGMNGPSREPGTRANQKQGYGFQPAEVREIGELPGFAADPSEMLEQLKGPMLAIAIVLSLVVFGFLFAFMSVGLLVGCRLVGQESPGFKKAYGIVIVQFLAGLVAGPGVVAIVGEPNVVDLGAVLRLQALNLGVFFVVHAAVLRGMLCDSMGKSLALALVVNLVLLGLAIVLGLGFAMCAGGAALLGGG